MVEGNVHRLKLIKRSMYGRASFGLLRARVLSDRIKTRPTTTVHTHPAHFTKYAEEPEHSAFRWSKIPPPSWDEGLLPTSRAGFNHVIILTEVEVAQDLDALYTWFVELAAYPFQTDRRILRS